MAFAQIYTCTEHGETIHPVRYEAIDTEYDEVYHYLLCPQCTREVVPLLTDEGKLVLRPLTEDELFWESFDGEF